MKRDKHRFGVAHHEASHATVAHRLGIHVSYICLDGTGGVCQLCQPVGYATPENKTIFLLAGAVAEAKFQRKKIASMNEINEGQWSNDFRQAAAALGISVAALLRHSIVAKSECLVTQNWTVIEAVAEALYTRRFLRGSEVNKIVLRTRARKTVFRSQYQTGGGGAMGLPVIMVST